MTVEAGRQCECGDCVADATPTHVITNNMTVAFPEKELLDKIEEAMLAKSKSARIHAVYISLQGIEQSLRSLEFAAADIPECIVHKPYSSEPTTIAAAREKVGDLLTGMARAKSGLKPE